MKRGGGWSPSELLPFLLIAGLTLILVSAPEWMHLPVPKGAVELTHATVSLNDGPEQAVTLPHRWPRSMPTGPAHGRYHISLDRPTGETLYLLIPAAQQELEVYYAGLHLPGSEVLPWGERATGASYMLSLPPSDPGPVTIEITLDRAAGSVTGYLSELYVATEEQVSGVHWVWLLATGGTRATVPSLQALVVLGIAIVWLARPRDPIFAWLFLIGGGSLVYALISLWLPQFVEFNGQSYQVFTLGSFGLMAIGLALAITGAPRPWWLKLSIFVLPTVLASGVALGGVPPLPAALLSSAIAIGAHLVGAWLLFRNSLVVREWDRALLAVPFLLTGWYGARDIGIVVGAIDGVLLLSSRTRPVTIVMILALLMRRLARSLGELDGVNETLRQKLAAREAELSALHDKERVRTAQTAREQERGRLMRDLHDGLSGHLVSIIALSESNSDNPKAIERAARAALDDLRLVVNSLDLDDGDLLLALAGLRERLEPQLRRLGFELEWSMENLPQVSGVTPGNALSILRILQEGITNALKHGNSLKIAVEGSTSKSGWAVLSIRNRVGNHPVIGKGHGVGNMKSRAEELGGNASFEVVGDYASLTLAIPPHLADA